MNLPAAALTELFFGDVFFFGDLFNQPLPAGVTCLADVSQVSVRVFFSTLVRTWRKGSADEGNR